MMASMMDQQQQNSVQEYLVSFYLFTIQFLQIKEMDALGLIKRNFDHPPAKDTVTVPDGGYTIIRFWATNPGDLTIAWFDVVLNKP